MRRITHLVQAALIVALSFHFGLDVLHAQGYGPNWRRIWTAPTDGAEGITTVHFFDERAGLVAHGGNVHVTTDGGTNWRSSRLKNADALGGVRDFYFKDRLNGYAAYSSFTSVANIPNDGVFKTTNGGESWELVPNTFHRNSVFEAAGGKLLLSSGRLQAIDSLRVLTTCAHIGLWGYGHFKYLRTMDGGVTWDSLKIKEECWGLYYQRNSGKFFCYPEHRNRLMYSTDFGDTWLDIPHELGEVTGDIQGSADAIYIQSNLALFRSVDQGKTFVNIGGPGNVLDTRFSVPKGCDGGIVVASDANSVWMSVNGGDGALGPTATPTIEGEFSVTASTCAPATLSFQLKNRRCEDLVINSAVLEVGAPDFGLTPQALPVTLRGNDSMEFDLLYTGSIPGVPSTGRVRIAGFFKSSKGDIPFDTVVMLTGDLVEDARNLEASSAKFQFGTISNCYQCDTTITLTNLACDSLVILSQDLTGGYFTYEALDLPLALAPGEKRTVRVRCDADKSGLVRSELLFIAQVGKSQSHDSVRIALWASAVIAVPIIELASDTIDLGAITLCSTKDTINEIANLGCDSVTIQLNAVNAPFSLTPLTTPELGRGDAHQFGVHFQPTKLGTFTEIVDIDGSRFGRLARTTIVLKGTAIPSEDRPQLSATAIAFEPLSKCSLDSTTFSLKAIGCDPIEVVSIDRVGDPDFVLLDQAPITIQPGETRSFRVLLSPLTEGNKSATIQVETRTALGGLRDTVISLSAEILDGTRSLIASSAQLAMGDHSACEERSTSLTLSNPGCDTLTITAADLQGSFTLTGQTFPVILLPGASITLTINNTLDTAGENAQSLGSIRFESNSDIPLAAIGISRGYIYRRTIAISMSALSPAATHESESVSFALQSVGDLAGVSTVDLDLIFDADLLSDVSLSTGSILSQNLDANGLTTHRVRLTPPFDNELLRFTSTVRLAVNAETPITVENVRLNAEDPSFEQCIARATANETSQFTFLYNCGDRTLQDALRKGVSAVRIISMRPNPVDDKLLLEVDSRTDVSVEILDALGRLVSRSSGKDHFEIDTRDLPSGLFFVNITSPLGSQVRSLIKR